MKTNISKTELWILRLSIVGLIISVIFLFNLNKTNLYLNYANKQLIDQITNAMETLSNVDNEIINSLRK
ncbi:MAG: hypothetical protein Q8P53_02345 [Candidatus Shapirobacteria bacterium]|nr:hypothetical protein [Candidatus Shapirobacteria bacterium]